MLIMEKVIDFKFKVHLVEYELGWGSRVDETKEFNTYKEAVDYINKFNSKNTAKVVPNWYMIAQAANFQIEG